MPPPSANDGLLGADLLGIDLLERRALLVTSDLPLRRVCIRNREVRACAELVCDRQHPLDELGERRPGRAPAPAREVDELAGEPVADRPPEVLLDEPVRKVRERLALVEGPRDARG